MNPYPFHFTLATVRPPSGETCQTLKPCGQPATWTQAQPSNPIGLGPGYRVRYLCDEDAERAKATPGGQESEWFAAELPGQGRLFTTNHNEEAENG